MSTAPHSAVPATTAPHTTATLADTFARLVNYYQHQHLLTSDNKLLFKMRALKKVVVDLRSTQPPEPVTSADAFQKRPGYGKGTLVRIATVLETGTLPELAVPRSPVGSGSTVPPRPPVSLRDEAILSFLQITGVGPVKAKQLVDLGATVAALQEAVRTNDLAALAPYALTHHQRLGVKYLEDTRRRVPRDVIAQFEVMLGTIADGCTRTVCGSYRRGNPDSGDVDVLVTHPAWTSDADATAGLATTVARLRQAQVLVDDLTPGHKLSTKYMGFVRILGHPWAVRLDVRAVPYDRHAPALMYFTGSKDENIRLRRKANDLGFKLNEYGLARTKADGLPVPECVTEEAVYAALGEAYVPPTER